MKKLIPLIVLLCIAANFVAGCGVNENNTDISMSDEYIIEKFNEAYDFWESWVYGQAYRAYDDYEEPIYGRPGRESVTSESDIQSTAQLREEMEKYFTKELTDMFFAQLQPEDQDGKLYIYTGDVGGPESGPEAITVDKINDQCYRLNLDIWSYMDEENPDLPDQCVYYVFEDGKWVFENDAVNEFFYSWGENEKYNGM